MKSLGTRPSPPPPDTASPLTQGPSSFCQGRPSPVPLRRTREKKLHGGAPQRSPAAATYKGNTKLTQLAGQPRLEEPARPTPPRRPQHMPRTTHSLSVAGRTKRHVWGRLRQLVWRRRRRGGGVGEEPCPSSAPSCTCEHSASSAPPGPIHTRPRRPAHPGPRHTAPCTQQSQAT